MAYIGKSPQNGVRNRFVYAATQGQTAFTGADADSKTLAISDALYTDVYQNGVKLKLTTDWTATTTTVTLVNAASADDVIEIVSFDVFSVSDTVPASTGGTFNGGIGATTGTFTGNLASTSSGVITNSLITSSTNQYAEQLFQDGNAGYALQVRSDNAQSTGTGSFLINDRDTSSFPVVIKEGNATNTLVLSGSNVSIGTTTALGKFAVKIDTNKNIAYSGVMGEVGNVPALYACNDAGSSLESLGFRGTDLRFATQASERMRIASDGAVHIRSTATPSATVGGFMFSSDQFYTSAGNTTNTNTQIRFINGNGLVGSVTVGGSSTSFNTSSDYRIKENVDYTWDAAARLKQLKPARFNFIADDTNTLVDGFLAHEVSSIVPEAITGTKDEVDDNGDAVMQSIDQSKLVPLLVKALQEQQTVIESLTTRITALEAE